MTTRNLPEKKRFVYRTPDKKPITYVVSTNRSKSYVPIEAIHPQTPSPVEVIQPPSPPVPSDYTPSVEAKPARRVVVIRNTKNAQVNSGPVDLGDFGKPNTPRMPPAVSDGNKSIYFIRRPITSSEPPKTTN